MVTRYPSLFIIEDYSNPWRMISKLLSSLQGISNEPDQRVSQDFSLSGMGNLSALSDFRRIWHRANGAGLNLDLVLMITSGRGASHPCDHVYAILGLRSGVIWAIPIDYKLPAETLYQITMRRTLEMSGELDFLRYATGERNLKLPSWCVDFSVNAWLESTPRCYITSFEMNPHRSSTDILNATQQKER